ncbi:MAG: nucleotide sugar dehydrogenase [Thermoplasmata archaeon]
MNVCVVGLGYIGLPTAVMLAKNGFKVYGYDVNSEHVSNIQKKKITIKEEGLYESLCEVLDAGVFTVGNTIKPADVFVVAVSTSLKKTKEIDLNPLKSASKEIAKVLAKGNLVIVESTVTPGTTNNLVKPLLEKGSGLKCGEEFYLAFCPERILPGKLMKELVENPRIIGGINEISAEKAKAFYGKFVRGDLHTSDALSAEIAKLMENTYRTVNIALANELAMICEKLGGNFYKARALANTHPRVNIHLPGPGVGGYCLTKDPWFLIENFSNSEIIRNSLMINTYMSEHVVRTLRKGLKASGKRLKDAKIVILGLAYKGDVSDPRESPGFKIYLMLKKYTKNVVIQDPLVEEYNGYVPIKDVYDAMKNADAVIIATEHTMYKNINWRKVRELMKKNPIIVDSRNIVEDNLAGFTVLKLGVGT